MLVCRDCDRSTPAGPVFPVTCTCGGRFRWEASDPPPARSHVTPVWREPGTDHRWWKREDLNPTGSFKDRGAEVLAEVAQRAGATQLVLDSSGSAALAGARVAAAKGLPMAIETPEAITPRRRETLDLLGARVTARGARDDAARRAREQATQAFWFSHVFHPAFSHGVSGMVEELAGLHWELPKVWYVPVGNGSLLLGLKQGLKRINRSVRLVAVQAEACPGLLHPGAEGTSRAGGIAIADPPRREEILEALEDPVKNVVTVSEEAIARSERLLSGKGIMADPSSAAVHAALEGVDPGVPVLAILSGAGSR